MTEDDADLLALAIHTVTAPLLTKIALLEARPTVAPDILEFLKDNAADLRQRMIAVEARALVPGPPGERGEAGPVGPMGPVGETGARGIDGPIGQRGPEGVAGKDGAPGLNGRDGTDGLAGKDGAPGRDGIDGVAGKDGAPGLNGKDGAPGPAGADGMTGFNGKDGAAGLAGKDGTDGTPGRDGRDGSPGLNGRDGAAGLDGKDGAPGLNGKDGAPGINGKDGADGLNGKDGADGLGFDDLDLVSDDAGLRLRFVKGEAVKEFALPVPVDTGVWRSGRAYAKGAGVTYKGAWWVAQTETAARPGDETAASRTWRLVVKAGRDGLTITKTTIDGRGHLILEFSDGTTKDVGLVRVE